MEGVYPDPMQQRESGERRKLSMQGLEAGAETLPQTILGHSALSFMHVYACFNAFCKLIVKVT